jgi:hypothetical protein
MRYKILYYLILLLCSYSAYAELSDIIKFHPADIRWSMALSQSAVNDWKQGEVTQIEFSSSMDLRENIHIDTLLFKFRFQYNVGNLYKDDKKNGMDYYMPTDNNYSLEGVLIYPIGWKLDPYFSASFNTQIVESYKITKNEKIPTAKHWDPVISQQSCGFAYSYKKENDYLLSRLGVSLKQTRTHIFNKLADDRTTKDIIERYKPESGIQWKTESRFKFNPTLDYKTTLDLFSSFKDLSKWAVKFENEFKVTIWQFVAILLKMDLIYNESQAAYLQYNQSLRFGIVMDIK